jgi:hypothetical protein
MQTVLRILKQAGGWHHGLYLKIENPPYMALVIEATDESGPCGLPALRSECTGLARTVSGPPVWPPARSASLLLRQLRLRSAAS